jgi:hypothetical protein
VSFWSSEAAKIAALPSNWRDPSGMSAYPLAANLIVHRGNWREGHNRSFETDSNLERDGRSLRILVLHLRTEFSVAPSNCGSVARGRSQLSEYSEAAAP